MEKHEVKQEELENSSKDKNGKIDELVSYTDMHYDVILGFSHGSHPIIGHPMLSTGSKHFKEYMI